MFWLPVTITNANIVFNVTSLNAKKNGMIWRWNEERGCGVFINHSLKTVTVFRSELQENGMNMKIIDKIEEVELNDGHQQVRIFIRDNRAEIYLNSRWLFNFRMNDVSDSGRIGFFIVDGSAQFSELRISNLKPLIPVDQTLLGGIEVR